MGAIDIALLAQKSWALATSWSPSVTIPTGSDPASLLVIVSADYPDEFTTYGATCTIDGAAATLLTTQVSGYYGTYIWIANLKFAGSHSISVANLRGVHNTLGFVVGLYNTRGTLSNLISTNNPSDSYTASPTIQEGQIWVEVVGVSSGAASDPTGTSGQTSLVLSNRRRVQYKKDRSVGVNNLTTTFPTGSTDDGYCGIEFGVVGRLFTVMPMVGL